MRAKLTKGDLLMASAVVAWGFSYIFMKWGLGSCTPFQIIFLRFGIAFPFLLLIFNKKVIPTKAELKFSIFLAGIPTSTAQTQQLHIPVRRMAAFAEKRQHHRACRQYNCPLPSRKPDFGHRTSSRQWRKISVQKGFQY